MLHDGKIVTFGIPKNLSHAQWREISSNVNVRKLDLMRS
jgi:hypothetical protein